MAASAGTHCARLQPQEHRAGVAPPGHVQFASVGGWGVAYGSQRENEVHRAYGAIDKAQTRLKAMSKYSRTPTRERLVDKLIEREEFVEDEIDKLAQMVF